MTDSRLALFSQQASLRLAGFQDAARDIRRALRTEGMSSFQQAALRQQLYLTERGAARCRQQLAAF